MILKSKLTQALVALGKIVSRTSPVEAYRSLRIEGRDGKIAFQTVAPDEAVSYTLPVEGVEAFTDIVNFDDFRTVVRACRNKSVAIECEDGEIRVDHVPLRTIETEWPEEHHEAGQFEIAELPQNFIGALATAAPIVNRSESRRVLQGIHLCKDGIVVTNGKELLNIEMPLNLAPLTIPFPHALLATKSEEAGRIVAWCDREDRFFRFEFGDWTWMGKALPGTFPKWQSIVPDTNYLPHVVSLDVDRAAQLEIFLKNIPDSPPNNPVTLAQGDDGGTLDVVSDTGSKTSVVAEFPNNWGEFTLTVNKTLLLRLLGEGHHRIACGDTHLPFIATGGIGTYIAMPLNVTNNVHPKPKEEKTMNETTPVVAAPVQPVARENGTSNPLDDLAAAIESFKTRLRAMSDESTMLARKVKEAAFAQKQKEREFVHAQRVLERVRMAI